MKILMATMGLDIGGAETHIVELAKALKNQGHEVVIVSNGGVYVSEITQAGIGHYQAPLHRRGFLEMRKARAILKDVIRREKPDVVHAHARIPGFLCGLLHRKMKFSFVTTAHWVFDTKGLLRYLTDWGEYTIAVSEDIKRYLMREYGIEENRITVTINGIDTDKFSPEISGAGVIAEFGMNPNAPIVSYVSRMDEDRALVARQLIELAPELAQRVEGVQLLIAGGGNVFDELLAKAKAVNEKLGRQCIVMTGPRTDINEIVAAGEVFVGVSRAALEAMAAGKPVIVAGNEGYQGLFGPDKLEQAQAGNFCCRGLAMSQPEVLLEELTRVLACSPEEKHRIGAYGRQVIFDHYSVHRMANDCVAMYERAVKKTHHVLMSGYYGFSNAGDDAILESVKQALQRSGSQVELTVLSQNPQQTYEQFGLKAVNRFQIGTVFSAMRKTDLLLFGGGSLLQDVTSTRSLLYYLMIIRGAQLLGKPVMLYANGIGPVKRSNNRRLVKKAIERASVVTLRDFSSADVLRDIGVQHPKLVVTADPVFQMDTIGEDEAKRVLAGTGLPAGRDFAAVSVREWPNAQQFPAQLAQLCDYLHQTYHLGILFLLMQPEKDMEITQYVRGMMKAPSYVLGDYRSPSELMGAMGQAKLCLAMRLHTLIFAARMVIPAMGMVYDPKVDSYLKELGLSAAGHVEHFDIAVAKQRVDDVMAHYDDIVESLRQKSQEMARSAQENERLLLELLEQMEKH